MKYVWIGLLVVLAFGTAGCGLSPNVAATAFAPTLQPPAGTPVSSAGMAVNSGDRMGAVIQQQGEEHRYTFEAEAGMAVTISMEAGADSQLDSYLELVAPDGSTLITDDDGGSGLNSRIENFPLPQSGEYTIVSYGYGHSSQGGYSLQVLVGTPVPTSTAAPTPVPGGGRVTVGSRQQAMISSSTQIDTWTFTGDRGDIVTIEMRSTGSGFLDAYLELLGPSGQSLAVNDDGGSNLDARIANYVLPLEGEYSIRASSINGSTGRYELALLQGQPPTPTAVPPTLGPSPTPSERTVEIGASTSSEVLPSSGGDQYEIQVEDPTVVEVLLQAEDRASSMYLDLIEPSGNIQTLVDFSNASAVLYLPSVRLDETGIYTFRVMNYESHPIRYTFRLDEATFATSGGGSIDYDQGVSGELLFSGQEDQWTFEGSAGDEVTIIMNGVSMDSFLTLLDPDDNELARDDDSQGNTDARIDSYTLPEDGTYTIVASSYSNNSFGQYRLMLFLED